MDIAPAIVTLAPAKVRIKSSVHGLKMDFNIGASVFRVGYIFNNREPTSPLKSHLS